MKLEDIILHSAIGFGLGLSNGIYAYSEKIEEEISIMQPLVQAELEEKYKADMEPVKHNSRNSRLLMPLFGGAVYAGLMSLLPFGKSDNSPAPLAAIPAAYLGSIVGSAIHRIRYRKEIKILDNIKKHPETIEDYLSPAQKQVVDGALAEIEKTILEGKRINPQDEKGPLKRAYDSLMNPLKPYSPLFVQWNHARMGEAIDLARVQKDILGASESKSNATCVVFGVPKKTEFMVYFIENNKLRIQAVEIDKFRLIQDENKGKVDIRGEISDLVTVLEEPWNSNYREIASRVLRSVKENDVVMFLRIPDGAPEEFKKCMILNSFGEAVIKTSDKK